nr:hypothetical protein RSP673_18370 [Ralstonia solanacearum P673]
MEPSMWRLKKSAPHCIVSPPTCRLAQSGK